MNQSRSEYVVAITWREKQISTLLCDRIHDDYIAAMPIEKRNKLRRSVDCPEVIEPIRCGLFLCRMNLHGCF